MGKSVMKSDTKVIIAGARLSYANLFEPRAFEGQEPKYSVSILIDKEDEATVALIQKAVKNAGEAGSEKYGKKFGTGLRTPLRDGDVDRPDDENYQGCYFINANSKNAPQVVGKLRDPNTGKPLPLGPEDVYSGCYANVSVNFYPYNVSGNKGVAAGLNNVQKVADGERLSGASSATDDFEFEDAEFDDDFLA